MVDTFVQDELWCGGVSILSVSIPVLMVVIHMSEVLLGGGIRRDGSPRFLLGGSWWDMTRFHPWGRYGVGC